MTDPRNTAAASRELPAEVAQREERHQLLATLLGAFADGELPAETASQIDAHLLGCPRCRRELIAQKSLRLRLEQEPLTPAPAALRDRILAAVQAAPVPQWESIAATVSAAPAVRVEPARAPQQNRFTRAIGLLGVVVALGIIGAAGRVIVNRMSSSAQIVAPASVPLFSAALDDYRTVTSGDLPGRSRDLDAVRAAMPFPVEALKNPSLRLLAAWTTTLNGEPAAVLAYRWNDDVVLQYIVSELQLYRPAELRSAFATGRVLGARDGRRNVVAWPGTASGSLIVGEISLDRLETLRATAPK